MWKDFFSFTKRERITIIVLTSLVILVQGLLWTSDTWVRWLPDAWQGRYRQEKVLRAMVDSISDAKRKGLKPVYPERETTSNRSVVLKPFNPNTADSSTLLALGLRSYVVKNMLKYRSKGGRFRKPADVGRIYGMTPEAFATIKPYIRLEGDVPESQRTGAAETEGQQGTEFNETREYSTRASQDYSTRTNSNQGNSNQGNSNQDRATLERATPGRETLGRETQGPGSPGQQRQEGLTTERPDGTSQQQLSRVQSAPLTGLATHAPVSSAFDLNRADTAQLLQIKGVGKVTAERIVKYRKQLGGFYSLQQLDEVDGLYPETKARLKSLMQLTPSDIRPLRVNEASLEKLREHPYISFWQAKVMVELRKARGRIRNLEELSAYKEFKPADLERLKWYLVF